MSSEDRTSLYKRTLNAYLQPDELQNLLSKQNEYKNGMLLKSEYSALFMSYLQIAQKRKEELEQQKIAQQGVQQTQQQQGFQMMGGIPQQQAYGAMGIAQQRSALPTGVTPAPRPQENKNEALKRQLRQETDPDKISPQLRKSAVETLKRKDRDGKREMLKDFPWLGNYLKQMKAENVQRKRRRLDLEGTSETQSSVTSQTPEQQIAALPLLAEAPLRNKLNLMVEQRGYSGCAPEVLDKLTQIITEKMKEMLLELKNISMYRNEEAYSKYITEDFQRQEVNHDAYALVSNFHEQNLLRASTNGAQRDTTDVDSQLPNQATQGNTTLDEEAESQALSGLKDIMSRRKASFTLLKSLQASMPINHTETGIKRYTASRKRTRPVEGNADFPPSTITPVDCEQLMRNDPFFRNSRTLASLYMGHLSSGTRRDAGPNGER